MIILRKRSDLNVSILGKEIMEVRARILSVESTENIAKTLKRSQSLRGIWHYISMKRISMSESDSAGIGGSVTRIECELILDSGGIREKLMKCNPMMKAMKEQKITSIFGELELGNQRRSI